MTFKEGDLVLIVHGDRRYLKRLSEGFSLNVGKESVKYEDIIGKEEGAKVGNFCLFRPTLEDIIMLGFKRKTQILYPKDSFYVAFKLGLDKTKRLLEFGVGSGASTAVFSMLAGEVWAYEIRREHYELASKNWKSFGLCSNVRLFNEDFANAQVEENFFDAVFIDVKDPVPYTEKVYKALKPGAVLASVQPTANQLSGLIKAIEKQFCHIEVLEVLHRHYKTNPERLRPYDQMVAHTGYLLFARKRI
ncbi:MAG: tRNA (adenine-N1)-methyltransferase [Aquificota bacterium]|nr:MAG: tRNA (adenine-N1)-methyltransferase [Aquificota bacterium]